MTAKEMAEVHPIRARQRSRKSHQHNKVLFASRREARRGNPQSNAAIGAALLQRIG